MAQVEAVSFWSMMSVSFPSMLKPPSGRFWLRIRQYSKRDQIFLEVPEQYHRKDNVETKLHQSSRDLASLQQQSSSRRLIVLLDRPIPLKSSSKADSRSYCRGSRGASLEEGFRVRTFPRVLR